MSSEKYTKEVKYTTDHILLIQEGNVIGRWEKSANGIDVYLRDRHDPKAIEKWEGNILNDDHIEPIEDFDDILTGGELDFQIYMDKTHIQVCNPNSNARLITGYDFDDIFKSAQEVVEKSISMAFVIDDRYLLNYTGDVFVASKYSFSGLKNLDSSLNSTIYGRPLIVIDI